MGSGKQKESTKKKIFWGGWYPGKKKLEVRGLSRAFRSKLLEKGEKKGKSIEKETSKKRPIPKKVMDVRATGEKGYREEDGGASQIEGRLGKGS